MLMYNLYLRSGYQLKQGHIEYDTPNNYGSLRWAEAEMFLEMQREWTDRVDGGHSAAAARRGQADAAGARAGAGRAQHARRRAQVERRRGMRRCWRRADADAERAGTVMGGAPPAGADARGRRPGDGLRSMTQGGRTRLHVSITAVATAATRGAWLRSGRVRDS